MRPTLHWTTFDVTVHAATGERYAMVLNVQRGSRMRFECHVDSNPLTGLCSARTRDPAPVASWSSVTTRRPAAWSASSGSARCSGLKLVT